MQNARFRVNIDRPDAFGLTVRAKASTLHDMAAINIGDTFGHLTVIGNGGTGRSENRLFCRCICGGELWYSRAELVERGRKTCGCRIKTFLSKDPNESKKLARVIGIYKKQARSRGLVWSLTNETASALINGNCYYCGTAPGRIVKNGRGRMYGKANGIDRKNNEEGYTTENSVSCCSICNHAKHTISEEDFLSWVSKVYNHACNK